MGGMTILSPEAIARNKRPTFSFLMTAPSAPQTAPSIAKVGLRELGETSLSSKETLRPHAFYLVTILPYYFSHENPCLHTGSAFYFLTLFLFYLSKRLGGSPWKQISPQLRAWSGGLSSLGLYRGYLCFFQYLAPLALSLAVNSAEAFSTAASSSGVAKAWR